LQEKAMSAEGRNQLLMSINQLLAFQSQELMNLRKLLMTQAHITAVALETERSRGDAEQQKCERYNAPVKMKPSNKPLKRAGDNLNDAITGVEISASGVAANKSPEKSKTPTSIRVRRKRITSVDGGIEESSISSRNGKIPARNNVGVAQGFV